MRRFPVKPRTVLPAIGLTVALILSGGGFASADPSGSDGPKPANGGAAGTTARATVHAKAAPHQASGSAFDSRRDPFFAKKMLIAYYGTPGTEALGVLGEGSPKAMVKRLKRQAKAYRGTGRKPRIVFEIIASVADREPGSDGNYSHYVDRGLLEKYMKIARNNNAYVVLDLQPGRSSFLTQAKHYAWALKRPHVGIALDSEWRMGKGEVPGEVIGSVTAKEINKTSKFVANLTRRNKLPRKIFMLHQFRTDMIKNIMTVKRRPKLVMVQHVDGFGTREQKLATYHAVAKPKKFSMGFKLFYDEDINIFRPRDIHKIKPRVDFVSYQ